MTKTEELREGIANIVFAKIPPDKRGSLLSFSEAAADAIIAILIKMGCGFRIEVGMCQYYDPVLSNKCGLGLWGTLHCHDVESKCNSYRPSVGFEPLEVEDARD